MFIRRLRQLENSHAFKVRPFPAGLQVRQELELPMNWSAGHRLGLLQATVCQLAGTAPGAGYFAV